MKKLNIKITVTLFAVLFATFVGAQSLTGTTWSYTSNGEAIRYLVRYEEGGVSQVTSYWSFTSPTDVIWYFTTPDGIFLPVGFGSYNASIHTITFSGKNPLNYSGSLFKGEDVVFDFYPAKGTMLCHRHKWEAEDLYNSGRMFTLRRENFSLRPNSKMVGSTWRDGQGNVFYFKSQYKMTWNGKVKPYVCLGNRFAIHSDDSYDDEYVVGYYNNETITVFRDGVAPSPNELSWSITRVY